MIITLFQSHGLRDHGLVRVSKRDRPVDRFVLLRNPNGLDHLEMSVLPVEQERLNFLGHHLLSEVLNIEPVNSSFLYHLVTVVHHVFSRIFMNDYLIEFQSVLHY
jgi:hypothetical protein